MKSILLNTALCIMLALSVNACSCQGQPRTVLGGPSDTTVVPPPPYMPSLIGDSVNVDTLSPFLKNALLLNYTGDPAVISYRVIQDPFPKPDSFFVWRKIRCNMSATRVFTAEWEKMKSDGRGGFVWKGKLVGTGETIARPDFNYIDIQIDKSTTNLTGYQFFYAHIRVNREEAYDIEEFPPYFVLVHYNPSKLPLAQDKVIVNGQVR
jgi:hypothetical protein